MWRFCKYLLFATVGLLALLLLALRSSFVQEFCLKTALESRFSDVQFNNFRGGASSIIVERILLKNKNEAFTLSNVKLDWKPWQLLFKRTLFIQNLQLQLSVDLQQIPTASTVQTAGIGLSKDASDTFSFLQPLQLPVKLHVDKADLRMDGHLPYGNLQQLKIHIRGLKPNSTGTLEYELSAETPFRQVMLGVQMEGTLKIQTDAKGMLDALSLNGKLNLKNGAKEIPALTYDGSVLRAQPYPKERLQLVLRCGQANEVILSGETLKTADHEVDFKAQVLFDHTLLQLLDITGIPTLSVLSEGTFGLNRKTRRWNHRLHVSIWAKDFDAQAEATLPMLSLKAQLEAESDAQRIDLKQYNLQLKEKGTERMFLTAHSLQPLTYDFKSGFRYASKENAQLLTVVCYEVPLEMINPYLQTYGYRMQSNLDGGQISVAWNEKEKQFRLGTPEPIILKLKSLQKDETPIVTDVQGKLQGYCLVNRDGSNFQYKGDITVTDVQRVPFLTVSSEGTYQSKTDEARFSSDGTLNFSYFLAKNSLNLTPFQWKIHPELNIDTTYRLSKEHKKNTDTWTIRDFQADIGSATTEQTWASMRFNQPLTIENDAFICKNAQDFADVRIQQLPLNIVQHPDVELEGTLSMEGTLSAQRGTLLWQSKADEILTDVKASFKREPCIDLSRVMADEIFGTFHSKNGWSLDVRELRAYAPKQPDPLLKTQFQCSGAKAQLTATEGQYNLSLDTLSLQPFALPYPNLSGTIAGNWQWDDTQKTVHSALDVSCTDLPLSVNLQADYALQPDAVHALDGELELKHDNHVNDLTFQQRLDAQNYLSGNIVSRQVFLQDLIGMGIGIQKLVASLPKKSAPSVTDTKPVPPASLATGKSNVPPFRSTCDFEFQSVADLEIRNLLGRIEYDPKQINLELSKGAFCQGSLEGNGTFAPPTSDLSCNLSLKNINLETLWKLPEMFQYSLAPYGQLKGNASCSLELSGKPSDLQTLNGHLDVRAIDGLFQPKLSDTGQVLSGAATIFGAFTGKILPKASAVGFLSSYARSIPFSNLALNVDRKKSQPVSFAANVRNTDLAIELKGSAETRPFTNWKQQPFTCDLQFRAPKNSEFLNYFSFNPQKTDANGYAEGPRCTVDGTLGKPNYLALTELLSQPPTPTSDGSEPTSQPSDDLLQNLLEKPVKKLFDLF